MNIAPLVLIETNLVHYLICNYYTYLKHFFINMNYINAYLSKNNRIIQIHRGIMETINVKTRKRLSVQIAWVDSEMRIASVFPPLILEGFE